MASTYSDSLKLELMETGANASTWGTNTNTNLEVLDAFAQGYVSKSVAGSADVTLTTGNADPDAESANKVIELTGALTGAISVLIPAVTGGSEYLIYNNTSGAYALTIAATGHVANGVVVTQGAYSRVYCDGTPDFNVAVSTSVLGAVTTKGAAVFDAGATVTAGQALVAGSGDINLRSNGEVSATLFTGSGAGLTGVDPFPSGTKMVFYQASAPTGWTQDTAAALSDAAFRVTTGSGAGTGGADTFQTTFAASRTLNTGAIAVTGTIAGSTGAHTLSTPEIPPHTHTFIGHVPAPPQVSGAPTGYPGTPGTQTTNATGGGGSHSHTLSATFDSGATADTALTIPSMNIKYANVIVAAKD